MLGVQWGRLNQLPSSFWICLCMLMQHTTTSRITVLDFIPYTYILCVCLYVCTEYLDFFTRTMPTIPAVPVDTASPEAEYERLSSEMEEDLRLYVSLSCGPISMVAYRLLLCYCCSLKEYRGLVLQAEQVQQRIMQRHTQHSQELRKLMKNINEKTGEAEETGSMDRDHSSAKTADDLNKKCTRLQQNLDEVGSVKPSTGSIFVRMFLGRVNVREILQRDRDRLREEYDKFKYKTNFVFIILPLCWAVVMVDFRQYIGVSLTYTHWIPTLTHIWLLYYYVSLSLRENILRVNGSRIMAWWIYHHYISAVMSIVMLTWPDTPTFRSITPLLTGYFAYQGVVQFVQTWYQRRRHYALRALGRVGRMDPSTTEGLNEFHPGLWVVVVLVILAYCFQLYMSYELMMVALYVLDLSQPWYKYKEEIQCIGTSVCFAILGVLNFIALVQTLMRKRKRQLTTFKVKSIGTSHSTTESQQHSSSSSQGSNRKYKMSPFFEPLKSKGDLRQRANAGKQDSNKPIPEDDEEPPPMKLPPGEKRS